jgi:CubicO group peptidase (beta-lactamase class C family)
MSYCSSICAVVLAMLLTTPLVWHRVHAATAAQSGGDAAAETPARKPAMALDELSRRLETYSDNVFAATNVPGMAIALAHGDSIILEKVYGVRSLGSREPVTRDTVFPLASLSKGMAGISAALVHLDAVENDTALFDIDAPLHRFLPRFELADPWVSRHVTTADCLSHRTGLPPDAGELLKSLFGYSNWEIFKRFRQLELARQFRDDFTYQNYVFTLGALAAANAAGHATWSELANERLFAPLGMNATTSHDAYIRAPNHAVPHILQPEGFVPNTLPEREDQDAASGVFASLKDMERWIRALANDGVVDGSRVLPEKALELAFKPRNLVSTSGPTATLYGLGWQVSFMDSARVVHHQGSLGEGVNTVVALLPDYDLCLAVLTNGFMVGAPGAIKSKFEELAILGQDAQNKLPHHMELAGFMLKTMAESYGRMPPPPAIPRTAAPHERYTGVYEAAYWGRVAIEHNASGNLVAIFGNSPERRVLRHYDGSVFSMEVAVPLAGPDAAFPTTVEFTCPNDKPCESVRFRRLDMEGRSGVFSR